MLGAGGASYGILSELLNHNVRIVNISNRTESKSLIMANHFKKIKKFSAIKFYVRDIVETLSPTVGMFINTSSIGMKGNEVDENKFESLFTLLTKDAIVYDINYNESQTIFNRLAVKQKLNAEKTLNGKFMLIRQAAESFNKWFEIKLTKQDIDEGIKILEKFI
jgi:shikimate 5-dehydrogenase